MARHGAGFVLKPAIKKPHFFTLNIFGRLGTDLNPSPVSEKGYLVNRSSPIYGNGTGSIKNGVMPSSPAERRYSPVLAS